MPSPALVLSNQSALAVTEALDRPEVPPAPLVGFLVSTVPGGKSSQTDSYSRRRGMPLADLAL